MKTSIAIPLTAVFAFACGTFGTATAEIQKAERYRADQIMSRDVSIDVAQTTVVRGFDTRASNQLATLDTQERFWIKSMRYPKFHQGRFTPKMMRHPNIALYRSPKIFTFGGKSVWTP